MRNQKFPQDVVGQLRAEVRELQTRLRKVESAQVTTVPVYDVAGYLTGDAVEGQVIIDSISTPGTPSLKFYQNSAWNSIGGGGAMSLISTYDIFYGDTGTITLSVPQSYRHLMLMTDLGCIGNGDCDDLWLSWNSGITTYEYVSMINGTVAANSQTLSGAHVLIPTLVPDLLATLGANSHLRFFFPNYRSVYSSVNPHTQLKMVYWEGQGGGGGLNNTQFGYYAGVGTSGQPGYSLGSGGDSTAITSITVALANYTWHQGSLSLYGIS